MFITFVPAPNNLAAAINASWLSTEPPSRPYLRIGAVAIDESSVRVSVALSNGYTVSIHVINIR